MFFNTDTSLRMIFDAVASAYQEGRPSYPDVMYQDLQTLGALPKHPSGNCLEIGGGCGQATGDLITYVDSIDCVEPGPSMCAQLRANLGNIPSINLIESDFETAKISDQYDLIFAGNSLHWIEKELAFRKIKQYLKHGGWLVGAWNMPELSPRVYTSAEEVISPLFPLFSIPSVNPEHHNYFAEGVKDFSTRGFRSCQQRTYSVDRLMGVKPMTQLIWSYVDVQQMTDVEQETTRYDLMRSLQGMPKDELWVRDVFFVAMGQRNG